MKRIDEIKELLLSEPYHTPSHSSHSFFIEDRMATMLDIS